VAKEDINEGAMTLKGGEAILLLARSGACLRRIVRLAASRKTCADMVEVDASAIDLSKNRKI
jgi:hypothetical protein